MFVIWLFYAVPLINVYIKSTKSISHSCLCLFRWTFLPFLLTLVKWVNTKETKNFIAKVKFRQLSSKYHNKSCHHGLLRCIVNVFSICKVVQAVHRVLVRLLDNSGWQWSRLSFEVLSKLCVVPWHLTSAPEPHCLLSTPGDLLHSGKSPQPHPMWPSGCWPTSSTSRSTAPIHLDKMVGRRCCSSSHCSVHLQILFHKEY